MGALWLEFASAKVQGRYGNVLTGRAEIRAQDLSAPLSWPPPEPPRISLHNFHYGSITTPIVSNHVFPLLFSSSSSLTHAHAAIASSSCPDCRPHRPVFRLFTSVHCTHRSFVLELMCIGQSILPPSHT